MANVDIRIAAKQSGVYLWELAEYFKCSEPTMTRKLRFELTDAEKEKFKSAIYDIKEKRKV